MVRYRSMLRSIRRKFFKYPHTAATVVVLHHTLSKQYGVQDEEKMEFLKVDAPIVALPEKPPLSEADLAAIRIQAQFRGHLSRKAYRALRSLVKLQALVRGVYVRKQAKIALHCMHVLVRLQVRVRARQLLTIAAGDTQTHSIN